LIFFDKSAANKEKFKININMHYINVHNKSDHDQEFEVHGFNDNQNLVVKPGTTTVFPAAGKVLGAIIVLHDGHEGEQAEITEDGYMGMLGHSFCVAITTS